MSFYFFFSDIIHGKLFQNDRFLEIDYAQGRDIPPGYTSKIAQTLQEWVDSCDTISKCIEEQINHANSEKAKRLKNKDHIEQEVNKYLCIFTQQGGIGIDTLCAIVHGA